MSVDAESNAPWAARASLEASATSLLTLNHQCPMKFLNEILDRPPFERPYLLLVVGYPVGGIIGGFVVKNLLMDGTWHDIFVFGGWATAVFIPIVFLLVPESPVFMDRRRKPGALEKTSESACTGGLPLISAVFLILKRVAIIP